MFFQRWCVLVTARSAGRRRRGESLESLVRECLPVEEQERAAELCARLRGARRRGYLTKGEFVAACHWKSPRPINHIRANPHHRVRAATRAALARRSDARRLEALRQLEGVSVPTASAILTLLDPRRYGVIDIRVWRLLHDRGEVAENPNGTNLRPAHWLQFLSILRPIASRLGVTVREVELALFNVHKAEQKGLLYKAAARRPRS
jgi:thermostable 8-oxoguanine DNA glycosylase